MVGIVDLGAILDIVFMGLWVNCWLIQVMARRGPDLIILIKTDRIEFLC